MARIKFSNGKVVNFDGTPTQADIDEIAASFEPSKPQTLAGTAVSILRDFSPLPTSKSELSMPILSGTEQDIATLPARPIMSIENMGRKIKDAALAPIEKGMDAAATLPLKINSPELAIAAVGANELFAKPALRLATPFTPSELGGTASMFMNPSFPKKAIAPNMSEGYMENVIPSSAKEIKHSQKFGKQDAAQLAIDRPQLGSSRADIKRNAISGIENLENQIQQKLDQAVKAGKLDKVTAPNDDFSSISAKLQAPVELPSGQPIKKYGEPKVGTIQRFVPEELNMQTQGKKFTKNNSRGLFQTEDPTIEAKQIEYLKKNRQDAILQAREAFKKRMDDPEYGYKIRKDYAISRDEIAKGFEDVIKDKNITGTENEAIAALTKLKDDFVASHPKWADVQYWNDVKRGIYRLIGKKGYLSQSPAAKVEAEIAIANRIKGRVQDIIPEIKGLNQEQGALLQIRDAIIESSPKEVRDVSLTGPIKERATIMASRMAAKKRGIPNLRTGLMAPAGRSLTYQDNVDDE